MTKYEFGLNTFGDVAIDDKTGESMTYGESLRHLVQEAKLADELGINVIALGEHHRDEFSVSSPEIVLAAMAKETKNIRLGTAVTVLSSDDPVRVYERFSTLDGLSNGRTEIMLGRGSFTESYPLFGYDLENYNELFEEKVALWAELLKGERFSWNGNYTQKLTDVEIYPKVDPGHQIRTTVGVGGTPESIVRAVHYGFPVMLAIIGGQPIRFKPYVDLYNRAAEQFNQPIEPLGMHSHGVIADTEEEAMEIGFEYIKKEMDKIGIDRGWAPMTRERFEFEVAEGSYYVGTPETVAQKIAKNMKDLGMKRFDLVYGTGGQFQSDREKTIRLYGEVVIPRVKELLGDAE